MLPYFMKEQLGTILYLCLQNLFLLNSSVFVASTPPSPPYNDWISEPLIMYPSACCTVPFLWWERFDFYI